MNVRSILNDIANKMSFPALAPLQNDLPSKEEAKAVNVVDKNNNNAKASRLVPVVNGTGEEQTEAKCSISIYVDASETKQHQPQPEQLEPQQTAAANVESELIAQARTVETEKTLKSRFFYASDHSNDIYEYLYDLEKKITISHDFMDGKLINPRTRSKLVNQIIRAHEKFNFIPEVLYKCIQILDMYLDAKNLPVEKIELAAITTLFLAIKYESRSMTIDNIRQIFQYKFSKAQLIETEEDILKAINFKIGKPLPIDFLRKYTKSFDCNPKEHALGKFLMENTLHDAQFSSMHPSYLAACCFYLAVRLLNNNQFEHSHLLDENCKYSEVELRPGMQKIAQLVLVSTDTEYRFRAVYNKYEDKRYFKISNYVQLNTRAFKEYANGHF